MLRGCDISCFYLLQSNYEAKLDHFELHRGENEQTKLTGRQESIAFLDHASRLKNKTTADRRKTIEAAKNRGMIDDSTTEEDLNRHAG